MARLGGDEFGVLMPQSTQPLAAATAQRLVAAIGRPIRIGTQTGTRDVTVGVSIGIALGSGQQDAPALMERADAAMYAAKRDGSGYGFADARGEIGRLRQVG